MPGFLKVPETVRLCRADSFMLFRDREKSAGKSALVRLLSRNRIFEYYFAKFPFFPFHCPEFEIEFISFRSCIKPYFGEIFAGFYI